MTQKGKEKKERKEEQRKKQTEKKRKGKERIARRLNYHIHRDSCTVANSGQRTR